MYIFTNTLNKRSLPSRQTGTDFPIKNFPCFFFIRFFIWCPACWRTPTQWVGVDLVEIWNMHPCSPDWRVRATRPTVTARSPAVREVGPQYGRRQAAANHRPLSTLDLPSVALCQVRALAWATHQTLIIVVIIVGRLVSRPPQPPTTNLPTGSRQTLKLSARAGVITGSLNMQICTPDQPARCQQG